MSVTRDILRMGGKYFARKCNYLLGFFFFFFAERGRSSWWDIVSVGRNQNIFYSRYLSSAPLMTHCRHHHVYIFFIIFCFSQAASKFHSLRGQKGPHRCFKSRGWWGIFLSKTAEKDRVEFGFDSWTPHTLTTKAALRPEVTETLLQRAHFIHMFIISLC